MSQHQHPIEPDQVRHEPDRQRFVADIDGHQCVADYRLHDGVMQMVHTGVDPSLQGRGIAAALVDAALNHARNAGLRVDPICSYVRVYMDRHPQTRDLLA